MSGRLRSSARLSINLSPKGPSMRKRRSPEGQKPVAAVRCLVPRVVRIARVPGGRYDTSGAVRVQPSQPVGAHVPRRRTFVYWLQGVTLAWMIVEFGVAAYGQRRRTARHRWPSVPTASWNCCPQSLCSCSGFRRYPSQNAGHARTASSLLFILSRVVVAAGLHHGCSDNVLSPVVRESQLPSPHCQRCRSWHC